MAVGSSAMCGTFKREILAGIHFWTPHTRTGSSAISARGSRKCNLGLE